MRRARHLATAAAALTVGALGVAPAVAGTNVGGGPIPDGLTKVNILNLNDFHGRIDTDGKGTLGKNFACTLISQRALMGADQTLTLGAGDLINASPFTSAVQNDEPTLRYLNAVGLTGSSVGNHEFDDGFADLTDRVMKIATFDYVGANVLKEGTTDPALAPYSVYQVNGLRVALIGGVTKDTPNLVAGEGIQGLTFEDPVAAVNRVADRLTDGDTANGEADVLVAAYHEGGPFSSTTGTLADQLKNDIFRHLVMDTTPKVSAIIQGHTHQTYAYDVQIPGAPTGDTRPVIQTGNYAANVGKIQMGIDPATKKLAAYTVANVPATAPTAECLANPQWQAAAKIIDDAVAYAAPLAAQKIGAVTADITRAFNGTAEDRGSESTAGNLIAQQYLESVNATGWIKADAGLMNPGGIRADLLYGTDGTVTFAQAAAIMPFGNTLKTADYTGAQLKSILEEQWQPAGASRPFLHLTSSKNLRWTYDPTRAAGDRITSIWLNDAQVKPTDKVTLVSNSFLITQVGAAPDNFGTFQKGTNYRDSGLVDQNAFVDWVGANSPLSPDFHKHGVAVTGVAPVYNDTMSSVIRVSGLDYASKGAPANSTIAASIDGTKLGTFPVTTTETTVPVPRRIGSADVQFYLPGSVIARAIKAQGLHPGSKSVTVTLRLVASGSGTVVTVPVQLRRR